MTTKELFDSIKIYQTLLPENGFTEPTDVIRMTDAIKLRDRILELEKELARK